LSLTSSI